MKNATNRFWYWLGSEIKTSKGNYKLMMTTFNDGTIDKENYIIILQNKYGDILWNTKKISKHFIGLAMDIINEQKDHKHFLDKELYF